MTREQVVALVEQHLREAPVRYGIHVVVEGVRQEGDWWTVPVFADEEPKRRWQYYEVLASVESDISDENKVNILLVPASTPAPAHG
jgi:hypothetical protein